VVIGYPDVPNDSDASLDPASLSCRCNPDWRWYCAWTHPNREHQAARELRLMGLETYLPLHLTRRNTEWRAIVPMFPRYLFIVMVPDTPWAEMLRQARSTGGAVAGLIRHAPDKPTPLPVGVIEDFISRTSWRGVVDEPEEEKPFEIEVDTPVSVADGPLAATAGIVRLSSSARCKVLMGMFNREIVASVETKNLVAA
jgi:transcription antitermination factor NusG